LEISAIRARIFAVFAMNVVAHAVLLLRARKHLAYRGESRIGWFNSGIEYLRRDHYLDSGGPLVKWLQVTFAMHIVLGTIALWALLSL
jgi:hypothetical protein